MISSCREIDLNLSGSRFCRKSHRLLRFHLWGKIGNFPGSLGFNRPLNVACNNPKLLSKQKIKKLICAHDS